MDTFFKVSQRGSTVANEVVGGLTTFLAMAYIIAVNPAILSDAGVPFDAALTATCFGAAIMTIAMGLIANKPLALASGMGINAIVAYTLCLGAPAVDWRVAMAVVLLEGIVILVLVLCGLRKAIMDAIPVNLRRAIGIGIGLTLASSAIQNASTNWFIAIVAIVTIIVCNIWGKGMVKIIPILLGVIVSYLVAAAMGEVDFSRVADASWVGLPVLWHNTVFSLFGDGFNAGIAITAIITIMPLAFATMIEHIGDISAISSTCNRNYIAEPGLHRTLLGDGLATILASLFGAPANTTYGENTGVLALTRVFDPRVIRLAAVFAIIFSFCPEFSAIIEIMPACVIGGVSLILYGMISAVGIRNLVENHVDFTKSRNIVITALIIVLSIGIAYSAAGAIVIPVGSITISLSGLAIGSLVGIIMNIVLPGHETVKAFDGTEAPGDGKESAAADNLPLEGPDPID